MEEIINAPTGEFLKWLALTFGIVGLVMWGMKIILKEKRVRWKLLLPMWLVEYLRISYRPHSGGMEFGLCVAMGYLWLLMTSMVVASVTGFTEYRVDFLPPVIEIGGLEESWALASKWVMGVIWYLGFNLIGAYSIRRLVVVTGKLEVLDKGLLQDRELIGKNEHGEMQRKYELEELSPNVVRLRVDALIPQEHMLNRLDALENATGQEIMRIEPEAGGEKNQYDVCFGKLKVRVAEGENGRKTKVSAVTWDDMPKTYSPRVLVMGVSGDSFVEHPIDQFSAMFVGGKPRSGKSVQLLAMIKALALATTNFQVRVFELQKRAVDFDDLLYSSDGWDEVEKYRMTPDYYRAKMKASRNHNVIVSAGLQHWIRSVGQLHEEIGYRGDYLMKYGAQNMFQLPDELQLPTILVIFDEALTSRIVYEHALKSDAFVKHQSLLGSMYFRGGYVNIIFCQVYHEMTKATVGLSRDAGLIYMFNAEPMETEHTMKRRVTPPYGQGIGLYRDPQRNVVGRYVVPYTSVAMAQKQVTLAAKNASDLTTKENMRMQAQMYSEVLQRQIYEEIHTLRMDYLAKRSWNVPAGIIEKQRKVAA